MSSKIKNKDIAKAVEKMMKTGSKVYVTGTQKPKIHTIDLYDLFKYKLTQEARDAIEGVKVTNLVHQRNEKVLDPATGVCDFLDLLKKIGNNAVTEDMKIPYEGTYTRVVDIVMYLGKISTLPKLETAVNRVCNGLNRLAKKGYITGALLPLAGIPLVRLSAKEKSKIAVVSYVALNTEGQEYMKKSMKGLNVQEGGLPKKV